MSINHFTVALKDHEQFILPFTFCVHRIRPNDTIEIITTEEFIEANKDKIHILQNKFNCNFLLRLRTLPDFIIPNSLRFLEHPQIKSNYLYITDVDILLLENSFDVHLKQIIKNDTFFSNIIRPGQQRLTGLHFTRHLQHKFVQYNYPQSSIKRDHGGDETMLYKMIKNYDVTRTPEELTSGNERPVMGLHLSLSRSLTSDIGMNHHGYKKEIIELSKDESWIYCMEHVFDSRFIEKFTEVLEDLNDLYCYSILSQLHATNRCINFSEAKYKHVL